MTLYVKLAQRGALTELCTRELTCAGTFKRAETRLFGPAPPLPTIHKHARNPGDVERGPLLSSLSRREIETFFFFMKVLNGAIITS